MPNSFLNDELRQVFENYRFAIAGFKPDLSIEPLSKAVAEMTRATLTVPNMQLVQDAFKTIPDSVARSLTSDYFDSLSRRLLDLNTPMIDPSVFQSVREILKDLASAYGSLQTEVPDHEEALSAAFVAIRSSREYLTEDQAAFVDELSPEILEPNAQEQIQKKRWTRADILALISIIFSLIMFICSLLPDKQLEEIASQNEALIEQQSREIELLQQLVDAEQQLLNYADQIEDPVIEDDAPALEADDFVEDPVEPPELVSTYDEQEEQADLQDE